MELKYRLQRKTVQPQLSKNTLQKYKKVNKSDKNQNYNKQASSETLKKQCKKYFIDPNNVYYQDRDSLKKIEESKRILIILVISWFILAGSYFLINRIKSYDKECPQNATCKVFVRCNPGYQLSQDYKRCVIQSKIVQQIQNVCKFQIQKLRLKQGEAECNQIKSEGSYKKIQDLKVQLTNGNMSKQIISQIKNKIDEFLNNAQNRNLYKFEIQGEYIKATQNSYTWLCFIKIASKSWQFKIGCIFVFLFIICSFFVFRYIDRSNKASKIYSYLKQKVQNEQKVNVTLLGDQMISLFGKLDQNLWASVDQLRKKDKQIGYYEDQYLYWKIF